MSRWHSHVLMTLLFSLLVLEPVAGQEARARWERMCQIRAEKFDLVLPKAMHLRDQVELPLPTVVRRSTTETTLCQ